MSTQTLTCIQASISDECELKVVTSAETYEVKCRMEMKGDGARCTIVPEDSYLKGDNQFWLDCLIDSKDFVRAR